LLPSAQASPGFLDEDLPLQLHFGLEQQNRGVTGFDSDSDGFADSEVTLVWLERGERSASMAALTHEMADCFLSKAALMAVFAEAEDVELEPHDFECLSLVCD
jgi:hypothetical protein